VGECVRESECERERTKERERQLNDASPVGTFHHRHLSMHSWAHGPWASFQAHGSSSSKEEDDDSLVKRE